ncbi:hypothetical protein [Microbulbifer sp. VAAF005]|uniref:hypothetical protein n=1 Tax=Microbulbifer sp. VAAF005 TaxID=3034230 RepID=UPI0024ADC045|nr:hypothetical protein [Microbulbifer sp. VAAF005]WHI47598.1 hypothetical protein P0078_04200 [Microbulbifer sp. VAAF005]
MIKKLVLFFSIFPFIFACEAKKSALVGVWKSNADRTISSMIKVQGVPEKARKFMEDDFFGHLFFEFTETEVRVYFDKEELNTEESHNFASYTLVSESEQYFELNHYDELEAREVTEILHREDNCFYREVAPWGFYEYFCKVDD